MTLIKTAVPIRQSTVAALCVSARSIYNHLPNVMPFTQAHDARTFPGGCPVVAHPPCRTWSKYLRHCAKPPDRAAEQELGRFCVRAVLANGGVLEQPAGSHLFADMNLPVPNQPASPFWFTLYVEQQWFGYATPKPTWLMICGVPMNQLPPVPFSLVKPPDANQSGLSSFGRSRSITPFAEWLCQIARLTWWQHI